MVKKLLFRWNLLNIRPSSFLFVSTTDGCNQVMKLCKECTGALFIEEANRHPLHEACKGLLLHGTLTWQTDLFFPSPGYAPLGRTKDSLTETVGWCRLIECYPAFNRHPLPSIGHMTRVLNGFTAEFQPWQCGCGFGAYCYDWIWLDICDTEFMQCSLQHVSAVETF